MFICLLMFVVVCYCPIYMVGILVGESWLVNTQVVGKLL